MRKDNCRSGFSLVEVMVALVILTIVVAGLAGTTIAFRHQMTLGGLQARATAVTNSRLSQVRSWPNYTAIPTYAGTQSNTPVSGWTTTTAVTHDTSAVTDCVNKPCPNNDVMHIGVTVTAPGLPLPVVRSYSVAP